MFYLLFLHYFTYHRTQLFFAIKIPQKLEHLCLVELSPKIVSLNNSNKVISRFKLDLFIELTSHAPVIARGAEFFGGELLLWEHGVLGDVSREPSQQCLEYAALRSNYIDAILVT